ncbi:MAG: lipoprotein insertase outer membrane protein LolB [Pseudomonadota bacterium]
MTSPFNLFIALLIVTLSGCAQQSRKMPTPGITEQNLLQHQQQVQAIGNWQAIGKLGVKTPDDGGSATLRWQQQDTAYQIAFNGPLGQGNMSIEGEPGRVTFSGGSNPPQSAKTAEELMFNNTGWNIPVSQLAYWVRGLPDPTKEVTHYTLNAHGFIEKLDQAGWKITYGEYINTQNLNEIIAMPGRITAEYREMRLTLLIREWKLGGTQ